VNTNPSRDPEQGVHRPDRREFLAAAAAAPWLHLARGRGRWLPHGDDRVLVVLELQGGNDGLNTVIPVGDARYAALRPRLAAVRNGAHALPDGTALHASLGHLHAWLRRNEGVVVHGVGYPAPDRSHFRSRDIWHTADPQHQRVQAGTTGWLGRAADLLAAAGAFVPAAALGGLELPLVLRAREVTVPSVLRPEDFQWLAADHAGPLAAGDPTRAVLAAAAEPGLHAFAAEVARTGARLAGELATALARYRPGIDYPDTGTGKALQLAARLAVSGFGTRLLHFGQSGYDTHAVQVPTHAALLRELDAALDAFRRDLAAHGALDRVVVLVHSEFGRRVAENASHGTDHGAAGPVFVLGTGLAGSVRGAVPDLQRLDDGDLVATTDFRAVYADLLRWLGVDARAVLGGEFAGAGLWPG
jgi:uncharacterized protein (DUF1501 family)